jgi:hypothetical protein
MNENQARVVMRYELNYMSLSARFRHDSAPSVGELRVLTRIDIMTLL